MRGGFTLIEVTLASSIIGLCAIALFEGVMVTTRIAHANSQLLVAEGVAWDAAWKRFNESYDNLVLNETTGWQTLAAAAAPELRGYDQEPRIKIDIRPMAMAGWLENDMKAICVDVEWGPSASRRKLSDGDNAVRVCRANLGRAP